MRTLTVVLALAPIVASAAPARDPVSVLERGLRMANKKPLDRTYAALGNVTLRPKSQMIIVNNRGYTVGQDGRLDARSRTEVASQIGAGGTARAKIISTLRASFKATRAYDRRIESARPLIDNLVARVAAKTPKDFDVVARTRNGTVTYRDNGMNEMLIVEGKADTHLAYLARDGKNHLTVSNPYDREAIANVLLGDRAGEAFLTH